MLLATPIALYSFFPVLCSTLQSKNKVSHSTQQFIRYVNLLEHVRKLKEEKMTRQTLTEMKKILINFGMSPELREGPVSDKLTSLLIEAQSEHSVIGIEDFCEKVVDFVGMAMECYPVLPVSPYICSERLFFGTKCWRSLYGHSLLFVQ